MRCIFIGHGTDEYGYQFWDPENRKILKHKDVIFNEQKTYKDLREALRRMISEWHIRALSSSIVLQTRSSSNLKMLSWIRLRTFSREMWNPEYHLRPPKLS